MFSRGITEFTRFKNAYPRAMRRALILAVVCHALLFILAPPFSFQPYTLKAEPEFEVVEIPPEIVIPPVPKDVPLPPADITPADDADDTQELPQTTFGSIDDLPLPPADRGSSTGFIAVDELPELLRFDPPAYPELAREAGIEGVVVFKVTVGPDGSVVDASVHSSDVTASMARAALESVKKARFKPARQRHVPVRAPVYMPYHFRLR